MGKEDKKIFNVLNQSKRHRNAIVYIITMLVAIIYLPYLMRYLIAQFPNHILSIIAIIMISYIVAVIYAIYIAARLIRYSRESVKKQQEDIIKANRKD